MPRESKPIPHGIDVRLKEIRVYVFFNMLVEEEQCARCGEVMLRKEPKVNVATEVAMGTKRNFPFATAEWGTVHRRCVSAGDMVEVEEV